MTRLRGAAAPALLTLLFFLLSCSVSLVSFSRNFEGGITHEFCQYAEIGRNILEGKGFVSGMVTATYLAYLDKRGIPFDGQRLSPVLDRFPVHAYLSAAAQGLMGKNDAAVGALSIFLLALCAAATFWVGRRVATPWEAAAAALFVAFNPSFQRGFVLWGLVDFGFAFLTLMAVWALLKGPAGAWRCAFAGALSGLAFLSRSNFGIWVPLFAVALWLFSEDNRFTRIGCFLLGAAVVSAPAWIQSWRWTGSLIPHPLAVNLADSVVDKAPSLSYRVFAPDGILRDHFRAFAHKYWSFLTQTLKDFPALWQMNFIFPAAVFGFYEVNAGSELAARRFFRLMLAMLVLQVLVFSGLRYEVLSPNARGRYFLWFAPAAFLLAARGAAAAGRRLGDARALLIGFALGNLVFFSKHLLSPRAPWVHPGQLMVRDWPELQAASFAAGDGLLVSNLPAQAAWYTRHYSVMLPSDPADISAIGRKHPVAAILISRLGPGELGYAPKWAEIIDDQGRLARFCGENGFAVIADFGTAVLLKAGSPHRHRG